MEGIFFGERDSFIEGVGGVVGLYTFYAPFKNENDYNKGNSNIMYKIDNIEIQGFWGQHKIETDFHPDINIFIGRNGTGKTTFINLLQAFLSVDLELLYTLQYDKIIVNLKEKNKKRKIELTKISEDLEYKRIEYKIGSNKFNLPFLPDRELKFINKNSGRIHPRINQEIFNIKKSLKELIDVSYLSVHRDNFYKSEDNREYRREDVYNAIDTRLEELLGNLTSYELQLETELSKLSKEFQENVLRSMLFNLEFDSININEEVNLDLRQISIGLKQAYRSLGILDTQTTESIDSHVKAIANAGEGINNHVKDNNLPVYPDMVTPLTLLRRTRRIIKLSNDLEEHKKQIFQPIHQYLELLNDFHETKKFTIKTTKAQGLVVHKGEMSIPLAQLSSGEKQLIILLTEALLQKCKETLFIADEPELSLHIEWQRKVISSITKLNPNAQIIIATHSPEIVGKFKDKAINMENIIYG